MAYRGRGRGRGRGLAKQVLFELLPEVENLVNAACVTERITLAIWQANLQKYWNSSPYYLAEESDVLKTCVTERITLAIWQANLQKYWNSSPYYLAEESDVLKKFMKVYNANQGSYIILKEKNMWFRNERNGYREVEREKSKPPLTHFIRMDSAHVPAELAEGGREESHAAKRVRWNPESDMQKLDLLEKLDQKSKGDDEEKKDGEDEDEEQEEKTAKEEEEFSDDGDYNQNLYDYDDDEDDYNMNEDNNEMQFFNHRYWISRKFKGLVN